MTEAAEGRFTGNITALLGAALGDYGLDPGQLAQLGAVLEVLRSDERAPTTVTEPREASDRHLADSLAALAIDVFANARLIADLGAGAGFPGVPLAVALPAAQLTLVESQRRKCEFLERLLGAATLRNASVACCRAEEWVPGRGKNDVVLARALAPQAVVLEYAAPLLRLGGTLVDWRARRDEEQERRAERAGAVLGMELREIRAVEPFAGARDRHLHVWLKRGETPERFPRRPGIARKRPLGA